MRISIEGLNVDTGEWTSQTIEVPNGFTIHMSDDDEWPSYSVALKEGDLEFNYAGVRMCDSNLVVVPVGSNVVRLRPVSRQ